MLKMLLVTDGAFLQTVLRAAIAVLIDKQSHVVRPNIPGYHEFGWIQNGCNFVPLMSLTPLWPVQMQQTVTARRSASGTVLVQREGHPVILDVGAAVS